MNYSFHPAAEAEFLESVGYYESRVPGLGAAFIKEFEALAAQRGVKVVLHSVFVPQAMADLAAGHSVGREEPQGEQPQPRHHCRQPALL